MSNITYSEYWNQINAIAEELVSEAMESTDNDREAAEEEINDYRLHETIDGHQWVIYYAYNDDVRRHSDNEDYLTDNFGNEYAGQIVAESGIDALGTALAFWCMYADVQNKLEDAFDEYEDNLEDDDEDEDEDEDDATELDDEVKTDIRAFIDNMIIDFRKDAIEFDGLDITFATNDDGTAWNYQTGDNSFTGACYGLPHWAVTTITPDTTANDLYDEIISQLTELLPANR